MTATAADLCCPKFDPAPWKDATLVWENKRFVTDRVTSFLHIPLNFGTVVRRNMKIIEATDSGLDDGMILSDEKSAWSSDVLIEVSKDVPGVKMTTINGTFYSQVFEGPFQNIRKWIEIAKKNVAARGHAIRKLYFYYTTCPRCAKAYGKNYVVILAQI